jgi:hypothetical protein
LLVAQKMTLSTKMLENQSFINERELSYNRLEERSPLTCGRVSDSFFSVFPCRRTPSYIVVADLSKSRYLSNLTQIS